MIHKMEGRLSSLLTIIAAYDLHHNLTLAHSSAIYASCEAIECATLSCVCFGNDLDRLLSD